MKERGGVQIQAILNGEPFYRPRVEIDLGGEKVDLTAPRRVRVVAGIDLATGDTVYTPIANVPNDVHLEDFPSTSLERATVVYDAGSAENSLENVRKRGSSKRFTAVSEGDTEFRIPKPDSSFLFNRHPSKIR